jgi:hypothetical protein
MIHLTLNHKVKLTEVIVPATPTLPGELHTCGGAETAVGKASFFTPRVVVLTGPPPNLSAGTCGTAGAPGGMQGVSPSEASGATVPPADQYDKQRVKGGQPAKFGYLPMMAVATLGALDAESFCECVLSCVKLVVSDLHVRLKPSKIRMLVMVRMNRGFMEYMRKTYPNTPLSEFRAVDAYVLTHGRDALVDNEEEEKDEEV